MTVPSQLRDQSAKKKWREGKVRPVPGNSPHDRTGKPGGYSIVNKSLQRFLPRHSFNNNTEAPQYAFSRHGGIYRSDAVQTKPNPGAGPRHLPLVGPRAQA